MDCVAYNGFSTLIFVMPICRLFYKDIKPSKISQDISNFSMATDLIANYNDACFVASGASPPVQSCQFRS